MTASVLVVDDDPHFRILARRVLAGFGLAVIGEAESVAAAGELAAQLRPQAFLVDVGLPDGDGVGLAGELASLPWHPHVLVTSSDPDAATRAAVRQAGARDFIPKDQLPNAPLAELLGPG